MQIPTNLKALFFVFCAILFLNLQYQAQDGALNTSFNTADLGLGLGDGPSSNVAAVGIQPDGKILVAGQLANYNGTSSNRMVRLNTDGTVDNTFNVGFTLNSFIRDFVIQPDGRIIIVGLWNSDATNPLGPVPGRIARLNSDGSVDYSFNPGASTSGIIETVDLQSDGRIIIGGLFNQFDNVNVGNIARLNTNGSLDNSFNPGSGADQIIHKVVVQPNNRILIGGSFTVFNNVSRNRIARLNANGSLDNSFNPGSGFDFTVYSIALRSDNRILVGGNFTSFNNSSVNNLVLLNANGSRDFSYNVGGSGAGGSGVINIYDIKILSNDRVLIGGDFNTFNGVNRNRIARLNANGSVDNTFDPGSGANQRVEAIAVQTNGSLILGGWMTEYNGFCSRFVLRIDSAGNFDTSFNPGTGFNGPVVNTSVQPDGRVLVGGSFTAFNDICQGRITRLNANGTLDPSFNPGSGASASVQSIKVQQDNRILIGGGFTSFDGVVIFRMVRLNTDGSTDNSFNVGTGPNNDVNSMALQPDGRIIAAGRFTDFNGVARNRIVRLNSNGSIDPSFTTPFSFQESWHEINSISLQQDGKIVIGGIFTIVGIGLTNLARLNPDGSLDSTFNVTTGPNNRVRTTVYQPNGKILIGGQFTTVNGAGRNRIARLNSDGSLDNTFNPGTGANNTVHHIALQPDMRMIIGGEFTNFAGNFSPRIARINPDGSFDNSYSSGSGANAIVRHISFLQSENAIIGGDYTSYSGTGRNRIAEINGTFNTCPMPSQLAANNITATQADLTWTENGSATQWIIEYGPTGFTQGTGTFDTLNTNNYTLTGLTPSTSYDFFVRAKCDLGFYFDWAGPETFQTICPSLNVVISSQVNVSCDGGADGEATVNASGGSAPYTFNWPGPDTGTTKTNLTAGNYTVTVVDANGCIDSILITILQPDSLIASVSVAQNVFCNVGNAGNATVSATGGSGAYSYLWSNSATVATQTALFPGSYTVTVSDTNNCQDSVQFSLSDPNTVVAIANIDQNVSCNGGNDGEVTVTATGGTGTLTYDWSDVGLAGNVRNDLTAGGYTIIVSDPFQCQDTVQVTITEPDAISSSITINQNVSCNGGNDGEAVAIASGGTAPFTYTWLPVSFTGDTQSNLSAGTYDVIITDANNCQIIEQVTINEPAAISLSDTVIQNVSCNGGNDGEATVSATGGTGTYSYAWSDNGTGASRNDLIAGNYIVTVSDANNCEDTVHVNITEPSVLGASATVNQNVSCNGGSDGAATVSASGGTSPYTFFWSASDTGETKTDLTAGNYMVTVVDSNGCTDSVEVIITEPAILDVSATVNQDVSCNGGSDGVATVSASGGTAPYTFFWTASDTGETKTDLTAGNYMVTVVDSNGCTDSVEVIITEPAILDVSATVNQDVSCNGGSDGVATVSASGGTAPYTFFWTASDTGETKTDLTAGNYMVTVVDSNGCTDSVEVIITEPAILDVSATVNQDVSCNGGSDGVATVSASGGTAPYTFFWTASDTGETKTDLTAGNYMVTVIDSNGCEDSVQVIITEPAALSVSQTVNQNVSCNGGSDGSATVSATGGKAPYTFFWSASDTGATKSDLTAGNYMVTVVDSNGCTDSVQVIITEPAALSVSQTVNQNVSCNGGSDGAATVSASGGTLPYTFFWTASDTGATKTDLLAGSYMVTVVDSNGCEDSVQVIITEPAALSASQTVNQTVSCNGGSDGAATVSATGGTAPYTFFWSASDTGAMKTDLIAGNYMVTVIDSNGCEDSVQVNITEPAALTTSQTVNQNVSCNGGSDGAATVSASGGTAPYTFFWSASDTGATKTDLTAGNYMVTVVDSNGCTDSVEVIITEPPVLNASATVNQNVSCNGGSDGAATISATGGTTPYTFFWTASDTGETKTDLIAGTYMVTVVDSNGCTDSVQVIITEPAALSVSQTVNQNVSCNGGSDGAATVSASGGTAPYTFFWSASDTGATKTDLLAGSYMVTVVDANGCTDSVQVIITEPPALNASATVNQNVSCNGGSDGAATISATGGMAPYTFFWTASDTGATKSDLTAGNYMVTVVDSNGCTDSVEVIITEPAALITSQTVNQNVSCNGGSDGVATVSASGGTAPYTFFWSASDTGATKTDLLAGSYMVTVIDSNGCEDSVQVIITEPAALSVSQTVNQNVSCNGGSDGAASVSASGGTAPYTFFWTVSDTGATKTDLIAGSYMVTVIDSNGCEDSVQVIITEPPALNASATVNQNVSCNGGSDGAATVSASGGTAPYTFFWSASDTGATKTDLSAGNYMVTVVDSNGCTDSVEVIITEPAILDVSATVNQDVSCNGGSDGVATVSASGGTAPYTFFWTASDTGETKTDLTAGIYMVTVIDSNGCEDSVQVNITEPAALTASQTVNQNVSCNGGSDGSATVSATGGTLPYTFFWSASDTGATKTDLLAGSYMVTVVDSNGCEDSVQVIITEPPVLNASATVNQNVSCNGGNDGSATVSAMGGTAPYTFFWSASDTGETKTDLLAGSYMVTVIDSNGCEDSVQVNITEPAALTASQTVNQNVSCNGGSDGVATVSASGGTAPYTFFWSASDTGATKTDLLAGSYMVTVVDSNGCEDSVQVIITEPPVLNASATVNQNVSCNGGNDGSATVSAMGGTAPYTFFWTASDTGATKTDLIAGTYMVTVVDSNGCEDSVEVIITEPPVLNASQAVNQNVSCNGGSDGAATVSATGGTSPYTFFWTASDTGETKTDLTAGIYMVTVIDSNGCEDSAQVNITEPAALSASQTVNQNVSCNGGSDGAATVSASGGTSPYTFFWSASDTGATKTDLIAGIYMVTVVDSNGCTDSVEVIITEPAILDVSATVNQNVSCNGGSDGAATVSATGGTAPYTFFWTASDTGATKTDLTAGNYMVTVVDSNGCTDSVEVIITEPAALTASQTVNQNVSCNGGSDGVATVSASGGTAPYTFFWSASDTGATKTDLTAGNYMVTVIDSNGCTDSVQVNITEPVALTASQTVNQNVSCNGGSDGSATVSATGGKAPYTFFWSASDTGATKTDLLAGSYMVTVIDSNGCEDSVQVIITEPATLTASQTVNQNVSCNGGSDGAATVSATGGTSPYTFFWSASDTGATKSDLTAGNYMVTVVDSNGCEDSVEVIITEPPVLNASATVNQNVSCNGGSDGVATVSASGGTAPYTFFWSASDTGATKIDLTAGNYMVTVVDSNGCEDSVQVIITEPAILDVSSTVNQNVSCNGGSDGAASVSASGGTAPYTLFWTASDTGATKTDLIAGSYMVTVVDSNGCEDSVQVIITEPAALSASATVNQNVSCNGGSDGSATVSTSGGTLPYTFFWTASDTGATKTDLIAGSYMVTVVDSNGCEDSVQVIITEPAALSVSQTVNQNVSCNGGSDGAATVSATGGTLPYTINWPGGIGTGANQVSLPAGNYIVTVSDDNNCQDTVHINIGEPDLLLATVVSVKNVSCTGIDDGEAELAATGGVGGYLFLWPDSSTGLSRVGLPAGNYTVTVSDANGCSDSVQLSIIETVPLVLTMNKNADVRCFGQSNGSVTGIVSGGWTPYTYQWNNGMNTPSITGLDSGLYTLTVTDSAGCSVVGSEIIESPANPLSVTFDVLSGISCNGASDGELEALATGGTPPYSYTWNNNNTGALQTGLSRGVYFVTVQDANNCEFINAVNLNEPGALQVQITNVQDENCAGSADGAALAVGMGGVSPYSFVWSSGDSTAQANGLAAGTYQVTVSDSNGCSSVNSVVIGGFDTLNLSFSQIQNVSCAGGSSGELGVSVTGGRAPYSFIWSNGTANNTVTNLSAGLYGVTVVDANGCTDSLFTLITQPDVLQAQVVTSHITCRGAADGVLAVNAAGGNGGYSFQWSNGLTGDSITGLSAGTYLVTVSDSAGCSTILSGIINEPAELTNRFTNIKGVLCAGEMNGSAQAAGVGGTSPYSYIWSSGEVGNRADSLPAGVNFVTVTDFSGCTFVDSVQVREPQPLTSFIDGIKPVTCFGYRNGEAEVEPLGGTAPYSYEWSTGSRSKIVPNLVSGLNYVTITDANGCSVQDSVDMITPQQLDTSVTQNLPELIVNLRHAMYTWIDCETNEVIPNSTGRRFTPPKDGFYRAVIFARGCADTTQCFEVLGTSSTDLTNDDFTFEVYPNPNFGQFSVRLNGTSLNPVMLEVMDMHGRHLFNRNVGRLSGEWVEGININLSAGVYFVKILRDGEMKVKRIVVQ